MKSHSLIFVTASLLSLLGASCTETERRTLATNATKDALAAGTGYLAGGKAGAVAGLTVQELANLRARNTAAKNPVKEVLP
jgi:hypothetical protein